MAIFNPDPAPGNDNMPNYFRYSEPIKQPKSNEAGFYQGQSTASTISAVNKGIEGGAELADSTVKGIIKNDVYSRVDPLTDGYIKALGNIRDNPQGTPNTNQPSSDGNGSAPGVNLLATDDPNVPPGLANGLATVQRLGAAQAAGKPSNTLIDQRLYAELKNLRSTYPGWRDYVDQEMQKATGKNIANELENSLREDIARQSATRNKETEYWQHQIVSNSGFPDSDQVLQYYNKTGDSNKVMQWLSFNQGQIQALALKKAQAESANQDKATQTDNYTKFVDGAISHAATIGFANKQLFGGISASDISDKMVDLTLHPEKANDPAYQNLGAQYEAMSTQIYNQTALLLNTRSKGPDGKLIPSAADILGPEVIKKKLDTGIGALFGKTSEFIKDKQFSPAYMVQQQVEALGSNTMMRALTDQTTGGKIAMMSAVTKLMPTLAPVLLGKLITNGLDTDLGTLIQSQGAQAITNSGGKYQGLDGKIYSFKQSLEELDQAGNIRGSAVPGQAYNNLLEIRKTITDPTVDPQARANAIKYFYDPINKGTMSKFMDDYYDPTAGRMVKGRSSAFAALTGSDVTKSVWEYANAGHPTDWQKYSNWAKGEFSTQLRNQIADVDKINKDADNVSSTGIPGGQFRVSWNSAEHQFILKNHDGTDLEWLQSTSLNNTYRSVQNLNMGLRNMANIAKTEGSNVDAYVFKVLKDAGYTPTKDVDGIPAQLMRAMIAANGGKVRSGAQAPGAPTVPTSRFAPEEQGGDLKSFLTNPAGSSPPSTALLQPYQTRGVVKGNLSDEQLMNIDTKDIPEGVSARDYIKQLQSRK